MGANSPDRTRAVDGFMAPGAMTLTGGKLWNLACIGIVCFFFVEGTVLLSAVGHIPSHLHFLHGVNTSKGVPAEE